MLGHDQMILSRRAWQQICQATLARADLETCGLLVGDRRASALVIDTATVARNLASDPRRAFLLDPAHFVDAEAQANARGHRIAGVWHSHPRGSTSPSADDCARAWPEHVMLITAPIGSRGVEFRSFARRGNRWRELSCSVQAGDAVGERIALADHETRIAGHPG